MGNASIVADPDFAGVVRRGVADGFRPREGSPAAHAGTPTGCLPVSRRSALSFGVALFFDVCGSCAKATVT